MTYCSQATTFEGVDATCGFYVWVDREGAYLRAQCPSCAARDPKPDPETLARCDACARLVGRQFSCYGKGACADFPFPSNRVVSAR